MPRPAAVLAVLSLALVPLAGCGGGEVAYTEVTSAPVALPIPSDPGTTTASDTSTTTRGGNGVKKTRR